MTVKAEITLKSALNYVTKNIVECVAYWNRKGLYVYEANKKGELGSPATQQKARTMTYEDYILECLYCDCKTFVNSSEAKTIEGINFDCGKSGSHLWIHENDERVLMLHF